jgi:hypothetical protein
MEAAAYTQHQAFVVTTTAPRIAGKELQVRRWAVLALSVEAAEEIVRMRVAADCVAEATGDVLAPEEIAAIGLNIEQATAL